MRDVDGRMLLSATDLMRFMAASCNGARSGLHARRRPCSA